MKDRMQDGDNLGQVFHDQVERLLAQHATKAALEGADRGEWQAALWTALEEAGLPLALLPEVEGGIGLPSVQAFGLIRRAAFHAAPAPIGETMLAVALWGEPIKGPVALAADPAPEGRGPLRRLAFGRNAAHALAAAGGARAVLAPLDGLAFREDRNLANEPRDDVDLAGGSMRDLGLGPDGLLPYGALLRAQQMCGAMERAMEMSLAHANERSQFGRPIAKFQAIQHMLAEAAGHIAAACAIADNAAEAWGGVDFPFAAALAKSRAGEAAGKVAAIAHQVHAAMGFTQEHPLHFLTRRLWSWRDEFGGEGFWEERIGREVCAAGGEALWARLVDVTRGRAA